MSAIDDVPVPPARRCTQPRNDPPHSGTRIDEAVLTRLRFGGPPVEMTLPITNRDRSVGARIAGELARSQTGGRDMVRLLVRGSAGQSFGAFCVDGMRLVLEGEANDYAGKGMSGGEIVIRPHRVPSDGQAGTLAGNTILYGATGGSLFLAGGAGERFAVRNSGAFAVVEGTGDHACEYMTAGVVVILGRTGRNVGAGMSGGALFAIDSDQSLSTRIHSDWVRLEAVLSAGDERWLRDAISRHLARTGSRRAKELLAAWPTVRRQFRRVSPAAEGSVAPMLPRLRQPQPVTRVAAHYKRFSAR